MTAVAVAFAARDTFGAHRAPRQLKRALFCLALVVAVCSCGKPESNVEKGNRLRVLHKGNGQEPQDLDPQIVNGLSAGNIIAALFEGLVAEDPHDLHPVPGVAERWDISADGTVYTFHLRPDASWSNGERVLARDFVQSYRRILSPALASDYAYMLYPVANAEAFNKSQLSDFTQVGFRALDDATLEITLAYPTAYFLSLLNHWSWFPVHIPTVEKYGPVFERGSRWTRPGRFVGNGPFTLEEWRLNDRVRVKKSATYWDAEKVALNEIVFHTIDSNDVEERAFRSGMLHVTESIPVNRIDKYRRDRPELLRIDPYLGSYFFRLNVTRAPLDNLLVRRALAMALDRQSLAENVWRNAMLPARSFTPPDTAGYTPRASIPFDVSQAREHLAQAGFPEGRGLPPIDLLFNTSQNHRLTCEAVQQMWRANLGIQVTLTNQEEKVYFDTRRRMDYQVYRSTWISDYLDANSFLDLWMSGGGNNYTGWRNAEYDRLIAEAGQTTDAAARNAAFQQAEAILLNEAAIIPLFHYTHTFLIQPSVKGWHPTLLDHHPYKHVRLQP